MFYHEVAELRVKLHRLVLRPQSVLLATVVIDELIAHCQLRQQHLPPQHLPPQLQVIEVVRGNRLQQLKQRHHALGLHIGQMTVRHVVELIRVMTEGMCLQLADHFRRDDNTCMGVILRTRYASEDMAGHEDSKVVLFNRQFLHVEYDACSAAQTQKKNDMRKHHIHAGHEENVSLFFHTHTVLLNGL